MNYNGQSLTGNVVDQVLTYSGALGNLPFQYSDNSSVVYNNEIHILGSHAYGYYYSHYKWDGTTWASVSTLPVSHSMNTSAVVYKNEIHIFGSQSINPYHYKWNGEEWVSELVPPYIPYVALIFGGKIHIMAGSTYHHTYNGTEWTSVGDTIPISLQMGCGVVYNDEIHALGGYSNGTSHYKYNGVEWTSVSTLPYNLRNGSAVVYNNEIHIMGGNNSTSDTTNHYKWNGNVWTKDDTGIRTLITTVEFDNDLRMPFTINCN